ncbi:hypothetical protein FGO68_gene6372 [Halteria grandinella]|uniref:Uncharacterized protein n=1 Tax=Halteria grandinella TaxID=5974 RepID=A0A8J8NIE8_HALGN|nr:hypothetical protein FGO68_gene6372 [Halteria grandinella]
MPINHANKAVLRRESYQSKCRTDLSLRLDECSVEEDKFFLIPSMHHDEGPIFSYKSRGDAWNCSLPPRNIGPKKVCWKVLSLLNNLLLTKSEYEQEVPASRQ